VKEVMRVKGYSLAPSTVLYFLAVPDKVEYQNAQELRICVTGPVSSEWRT